MPRGRFERWSWQIYVAALISQYPHLQYLTSNVSGITPVKRVENQGSPYLVSGNSAPVNSLWLLKCPCYVSLWHNQGPKCQLGNGGWAQAPMATMSYLQNGVKNGLILPRFVRVIISV